MMLSFVLFVNLWNMQDDLEVEYGLVLEMLSIY